MTQATAESGLFPGRRFPGRRADTGLPAHPGHAGPQPVTKRAEFRLTFENRHWHKLIMS